MSLYVHIQKVVLTFEDASLSERLLIRAALKQSGTEMMKIITQRLVKSMKLSEIDRYPQITLGEVQKAMKEVQDELEAV